MNREKEITRSCFRMMALARARVASEGRGGGAPTKEPPYSQKLSYAFRQTAPRRNYAKSGEVIVGGSSAETTEAEEQDVRKPC